MDKKPLRPRELTAYDRKILKALASQDGAVTQFALVGWHLGRDDTWGAMGIGITHIEKLHKDGYVCREGDHVLLDDEQRAFVAGLTAGPPEHSLQVLYLLYHARRPLRPGAIADMLSPAFFDSLTGRLRHFYTDRCLGPAYTVGVILSQARDVGLVARLDGVNYWLTDAQRCALAMRFPEWNAGMAPTVTLVRTNIASTFGRAGRGVELD